jgi:FHS family glucose/mannose:H+ symporter-like MFS transporter
MRLNWNSIECPLDLPFAYGLTILLLAFTILIPLVMQTKNETGRLPTLILHLAFLFSGMATVLIGQVLPILARNFSLNDLQLGYLFPAQFAGSVTGTLINSLFARRGQYSVAITIGCILIALGILLIGGGSFEICLAGFLINGLGIGMTLPSINLLILEMNPLRAASALSILNFCWGVGAIFCKPFVDLVSGGTHIRPVTIFLSSVMLLFGFATFFTVSRRPIEKPEAAVSADTPSQRIWTSPIAWTIALFNFIHVGFESGMGGWLATYTDRLANRAVLDVLSPTLLYFSFFVIGRGIAPLYFKYLTENRVLFICLSVLLLGVLITIAASNVVLLSIGASIAGLGTSSIFPTNVSRFVNIFGPEANRRATPLFLSGTAGAAIVTWLIGLFSERAGNLRSGMVVLAVSIVLLIVIQLLLYRKMAKPLLA